LYNTLSYSLSYSRLSMR